MTIADILVGGFLVTGPVALVIAHQTGRMTDWWSAVQGSSRRTPRL